MTRRDFRVSHSLKQYAILLPSFSPCCSGRAQPGQSPTSSRSVPGPQALGACAMPGRWSVAASTSFDSMPASMRSSPHRYQPARIGLVAPYGFSFGILTYGKGGSIPTPQSGASRRIRDAHQIPARSAARCRQRAALAVATQSASALLRAARFPSTRLAFPTSMVRTSSVYYRPGRAASGRQLASRWRGTGAVRRALFDWRGRFGTPELGIRIGWHLPFIRDVTVFAEGGDARLPGAYQCRTKLIPERSMTRRGQSSERRPRLRLLCVQADARGGLRDGGPRRLLAIRRRSSTLRFADGLGQRVSRPQSAVVDAAGILCAGCGSRSRRSTRCSTTIGDLIDDPHPPGPADMNLVGHRTQDGQHCVTVERPGSKGTTAVKRSNIGKTSAARCCCHDQARKQCFAQRTSSSEPWGARMGAQLTRRSPARTVFLKMRIKGRLIWVPCLRMDRITDGSSSFRSANEGHITRAAADRSRQSGASRQHPPIVYESTPTKLQRLSTALGRGTSAASRRTSKTKKTKAAAAAADERSTPP